jgi:hypothetical protein
MHAAQRAGGNSCVAVCRCSWTGALGIALLDLCGSSTSRLHAPLVCSHAAYSFCFCLRPVPLLPPVALFASSGRCGEEDRSPPRAQDRRLNALSLRMLRR